MALFYIFIRNLMKFKASKKELLQALDLASRFVSRNSTLPILENVAIIGNIDTIQLKATDMNKYIHISFPAEIESE
jgi:DNA polymerase III sliding clamp (beta) subunit (PCNA family)